MKHPEETKLNASMYYTQAVKEAEAYRAAKKSTNFNLAVTLLGLLHLR